MKMSKCRILKTPKDIELVKAQDPSTGLPEILADGYSEDSILNTVVVIFSDDKPITKELELIEVAKKEMAPILCFTMSILSKDVQVEVLTDTNGENWMSLKEHYLDDGIV